MATQEEIVKLAESLKANGLAASGTDAITMAERMLGKAETPEKRFDKSAENVKSETGAAELEEGIAEVEKELEAIEAKKEKTKEPGMIRIEDIEPVEKKEDYDISKNTRTVKELFEIGEVLDKKEEGTEADGFKEIPVDKKKKRPALTEEEKKSTDLTKWFYFGKK